MRKIVIFAVINLVLLGSLTAPVVTGLPIAIARLVPETDRTSVLAVVTIAGAVASVIANPLFGYLSDRTTSRFGRRRPWLVAGVVAGLGATAIIVTAESVAVLALGWVLAQTAYNASLAAVAAMLGDQVSERRRASASGLFGAAAFLGTLPPLVLAALVPAQLPLVLLAMPVLAVIVVAVCCVFVDDPRRDRVTALIGSQARTRFALSNHSAFAWIWLQRFLVHLAFSLVTAFAVYFVAARLGLSAEDSSPTVAITTMVGGAAIVVAALGAGFLAGRRGRYGRYIAVAAVGLAVAAAMRATVTDSAMLWVSAAVGGICLGIFYAVDLALALRTVPPGESGKFLGVLNIAETLPQTIAPSLGLLVLAVSGTDPLSGASENFAALYLTAAVVALLALVPLAFLKPVLSRTDGVQVRDQVPRSTRRRTT